MTRVGSTERARSGGAGFAGAGSGLIVLKVGGSSITISGGNVVLDSKEVKLTATGPLAELAAVVTSK